MSALSRARPAHHMRHPRRPEPDLCVAETCVHFAKDVVLGDEHVGEGELAVTAEHRPVQRGDVSIFADARHGRRC